MKMGSEVRELAEVASVIRGVTFSKSEASSAPRDNWVPILRAGNISDTLVTDSGLIWLPRQAVAANQLARVNDIAICMSSGSSKVVGKSAMVAQPWVGSVGAFCALIRPDPTSVEPEFLAHFLRCSTFREWTRTSSGANIKNIRKRELEQFSIPLPSLEEQRRIVDILNRAASIGRLRATAATHLRDFTPALFNRMFGDQFDIGNRYPTLELKQLAEIGSGITKGRKVADEELVVVPYLRVANVQEGYLDLDAVKTIPIRPSERDKYALDVGDLVLTEGGDPDKLGRGAIWEGQLPYCAHQNHVFRVRPDRTQVTSEYLKSVVGSGYGKAYFLTVAKQTTGIASINKTQLGQFPVPVPPLSLQHRFTDIVVAAAKKVELARKADALAQDLSASLLDRLLRGDD